VSEADQKKDSKETYSSRPKGDLIATSDQLITRGQPRVNKQEANKK
jgi:hypothetical protein